MSYFSRFVLLLAFFCLAKPAFAQTEKFSEDQKALLKEALKVAFVTEKNFPHYNDLKSKKKIILHDNMIAVDDFFKNPIYLTDEVLPEIKNLKIDLQSEAEIKAEKQKKDLMVVRMGQIDQPTSDYAMVHIFGEWDLGEESRKKGFLYKEAFGYTLLFKKENGVWKYQKVVNRLPNPTEQRKQI